MDDRWLTRVMPWVAAAAMPLGLGCQGERAPDPMDGATGIGLPGDGTGGDAAGDDDEDADADDDGEPLDLGGGEVPEPDDECATLVEHAELEAKPQDIMIFVDNSSSMEAEAGFVQAELNAFSSQIVAANVDAHIILVSSYPGQGHGMCIEPPLGSGGCPMTDSNPPNFVHLGGIIESNFFSLLVDRYDEYRPHLREDAALHIVGITDFDAGVPVATFLAEFNAVAPELSEFVFHGIIAPQGPDEACALGTSCCGIADQKCAQFQEIIAMTGGVEGNLCDQEFQPVFDALAQAVIGEAALPCSYAIPLEQAGPNFDPDKVNVEFDDGAGTTLEFGYVPNAAACAGVSGGWYYDDPATPTEIHLCAQTCEDVQGLASASIAFIFGCDTVPAG